MNTIAKTKFIDELTKAKSFRLVSQFTKLDIDTLKSKLLDVLPKFDSKQNGLEFRTAKANSNSVKFSDDSKLYFTQIAKKHYFDIIINNNNFIIMLEDFTQNDDFQEDSNKNFIVCYYLQKAVNA